MQVVNERHTGEGGEGEKKAAEGRDRGAAANGDVATMRTADR